MDHPLQMISYIADIGSLVVLMVRRKPIDHQTADSAACSSSPPKKYWMICHVFSSDDVSFPNSYVRIVWLRENIYILIFYIHMLSLDHFSGLKNVIELCNRLYLSGVGTGYSSGYWPGIWCGISAIFASKWN